MKIYLVMRDVFYERSDVMGAFKDIKNARIYLKRLIKENHLEKFNKKVGKEYWSSDYSREAYYIDEMELN